MGLGEQILNQAERKFGKLAFPGILRWVAGFQLLGFIMVMFSQGYTEMIAFDKGKIMSGEVWRLISWVFMPSSSILFIIQILFTFFLNDLIEEAIGTFRLNLYVIGMIIFLTIAALSPFSNGIYRGLMSFAFFSSMIFAAASFFPNYVIHLMGIIPIKMKWLGWMDAAILIGTIAQNQIPLINTGLVLVGLIPFLVGVFPAIVSNFKNDATAAARRAKFQKDSAASDGAAFHTCKECGITDVDDPTLEFRVSADDGEEYCLPCREKQT